MADEKNTNETLNLKDKDLEKVAGGVVIGDFTEYECTTPGCTWSTVIPGEPMAGMNCPFCRTASVKATYHSSPLPNSDDPGKPYAPPYSGT